MKTGLIIIILIVVILLFMAAGWYVMNKIDGFMNRTRRTNDKDTMNAVLKESDDRREHRGYDQSPHLRSGNMDRNVCCYIQNKIRW